MSNHEGEGSISKTLARASSRDIPRRESAGHDPTTRTTQGKKNASEEENKIGTNPVLTVYRYSLRVWHFSPSIHEFVSLFPPGWGDYPLWMKRRAEILG